MLVVCLLFLIALTAKECLGGSSKSRFVNFQQHSGAITSCEHDSAIRSCTAIYVDTNSPPRLPLEYSFEVVAQDLDPSVHWIVKADINGDGRPDLISVVFGSLGRHTWFENTGNADQPFVSHVITSGKEGSIHMDVGDVNGDGHLDVILAYKWGHCFMACTKKDGKVTWLENPGITPSARNISSSSSSESVWKEHVIVENFKTGVHRVMWIENGNRQYVLASGMVEADSDSTKEYLDRPVRQILYEKIQGGAGARGYDGEILWKESVFDENLYLVHEVYRSPLSSDSLIVTSYDGVYDIQIDKEKASLNKILLPSSLRPRNLEKAGWISNFTPFVYPTVVSAVYSNEKNTTYTHPLQTAEFYASIEPLHGNILAVYSKESSTSSLPAASFTRSVIDKRDFEPYLISPSGELIAPKDRTRNHVYEHGGHDVIQMDFDCDGIPEIFAAWRGSQSLKGKGFVMYKLIGAHWQSFLIDGGSYNHFEVGDYDGDGLNDIAIAGWGSDVDDHKIAIMYNREENCYSKIVS